MSADLFRRAATHARELAKCGHAREFPAPWGTEAADVDVYGVADRVTCEGGNGDVTEPIDPLCAEHIAAWGPDVGLVAADLFDHEAERLEIRRRQLVRDFGEDKADDFLAVPEHIEALARALLREVTP